MLGLLKVGIELVAGFGGGLVIDNIVKITTPGTIGAVEKMVVRIGGFFISGMVGDMTANYAGRQVDRVAEQIVKLQAKMTKTPVEPVAEKKDGKNGEPS